MYSVYPFPPSMLGRPDMPGHNHPPFPSCERQQKWCRRKDTLLCAVMGRPEPGCFMCVHEPCAGCNAAIGLLRQFGRERRKLAQKGQWHMKPATWPAARPAI